LIVLGVLAAALGLTMYRDGAHHRAMYQDFQLCKESGAVVCILRQDGSEARSEQEFTKNFETQFLVGRTLMVGGGVFIVAGAAFVFVRRKRRAQPLAGPPPWAAQPPSPGPPG